MKRVSVVLLVILAGFAIGQQVTFEPLSVRGLIISTGGSSSGGSMVYPSAGIAKSTGTAWTATAFGDIVALFSAGCSGVMYLGADGACHTASGGGSSARQPEPYVYDSFGASIPAGFTSCQDLKVSGTLTAVRLNACNGLNGSNACNAGGTGTFDILLKTTTSPDTTGPTSLTSMHGSGSLLQITNQYGIDGVLTGWNTTVAAGQTMCVTMSAPGAISLSVTPEIH